ncbi:MAG: hypothetical protein RL368_107 [Pseudomonadota bacterium]
MFTAIAWRRVTLRCTVFFQLRIPRYMSVYTTVERDQLEEFLTHYDLGQLVCHQGISAGIENTNYFVTTDSGEFILTLFEQYSFEELPYFLELMAYLAEHEVPSAHPLADKSGHYLRELNARPAALVRRLNGRDVSEPSVSQCAAIGDALGKLHQISPDFPHHRDNGRGEDWRYATALKLVPLLNDSDAQILREELAFQADYCSQYLPRGVVHADLFRDNALFEGDNLCGLIDFYYACNDALLYDVAVTLNDWCSAPDGSLDPARADAFLSHYRQQRKLTADECESWEMMLRAAALRFWLSRLLSKHFPREGEMTHIKDPNVFRDILIARRHIAPLKPD